MSNSSNPPSAVSSERPATRLTAPALRRGLDILELLVDHRDGLRAPEIAAALGIPRASTHELVQTLAERGYVQTSPDSPGRFSLGARVFHLGGAYERSLDVVDAGRRTARAVAARCGETVQVVIRDGRHVVYVARIDSTHTVRLVSDVGSRLPAHCTAGGKALLASLSDAELLTLFPDDSLPGMTEHSIADRTRLLEEVAVVRDRGWADEYCESNPNVACVAAPVYGPRGECVAAMSISVPTLRWQPEREGELVELVREGARELSTSLGARL